MIWGVFSFNGTVDLQVVQGHSVVGYVEMLQRASLMTEGPHQSGDCYVFSVIAGLAVGMY